MANYLYNGVKLPDISEVLNWSANFRNVFVFSSNGNYYAIATRLDMSASYNSATGLYDVGTSGQSYVGQFELVNNAWERTSYETAQKITVRLPIEDAVWTSKDIYLADGETVFLAYSEPVPAPDYPLETEVMLTPASVEVTAGQAQDIRFALTGTDGTDYTGIAAFAYVITDKNGIVDISSAPWVSWVDGEHDLLRITADAPGGHEITVIAVWGTEDDPQSLWAEVTIPTATVTAQWIYSFKMGLALGLAGKPLPMKETEVIAVRLENVLYIKKAPATVSGNTLILCGGKGA